MNRDYGDSSNQQKTNNSHSEMVLSFSYVYFFYSIIEEERSCRFHVRTKTLMCTNGRSQSSKISYESKCTHSRHSGNNQSIRAIMDRFLENGNIALFPIESTFLFGFVLFMVIWLNLENDFTKEQIYCIPFIHNAHTHKYKFFIKYLILTYMSIFRGNHSMRWGI